MAKETKKKELTAGAISIFAVLMTRQDPIFGADLAQLLKVTKLDSNAIGWLKQEDLLHVDRAIDPKSNSRSKRETYLLNDNGWNRAREIMIATPNTTNSASRAMYTLLAGLDRALTAAGQAAKSFFQPVPDTSSTEDLIRKAYRELRRRPGDWVRLADVRDQLTGQDRTDVDEALKALADQPGVQLIPWDNRNALEPRDHDAALRYGGEQNHAIRIEEA
jgi:hypothetical protein